MTRAIPGKVVAALALQILLGSLTHLAAKRATMVFPPLALTSLRLTLAGLVFALVLRLAGAPVLPPRALWGWVLLFGLVVGPGNQGLFMYGLSRSQATHAGLLYALTPLGVYLVAVLLGRERARVERLAGIALALSGVVVLLLGRGLAEALGPLVGDLFILAAVGCWVAWTTESRRVAQVHGGLRTAAWGMMSAGLWALPSLPFTVDADVVARADLVGWLCLGFLVVFSSVAGYALWNYALSRAEASTVAVSANLQPLITGLLAWALLDEHLPPSTLGGGLLVVAGVYVAQRGGVTAPRRAR